MFCQNCVTCPSIRTDPGIPPPGYSATPHTRVLSVLILGQVTQYGNPYLICITKNNDISLSRTAVDIVNNSEINLMKNNAKWKVLLWNKIREVTSHFMGHNDLHVLLVGLLRVSEPLFCRRICPDPNRREFISHFIMDSGIKVNL